MGSKPQGIHREIGGIIIKTTVEQHHGFALHHINISLPPGSRNKDIGSMKNLIFDHSISLLSGFLFIPYGSDLRLNLLERLSRQLADIPLNWLEGSFTPNIQIQLTGVTGVTVDNYKFAGTSFCRRFFTGRTGHYYFSDYVDAGSQNRPQSASKLFKRLQENMTELGLSISNLVRTWIFLDGILDWYDEFNTERTIFFRDSGVLNGVIPSSTGIGISNLVESPLLLTGYAVQSDDPEYEIFEVRSPLQCPATEYKSSFSRAVEYRVGRMKRLLISGTASIDRDGKTYKPSDIKSQISHTMNSVGAILDSRSYSWGDVVRSNVYFTDQKNIRLFTDYCEKHGIDHSIFLFLKGVICRPDLLFEIEVDASG